MVVGTPEYMPPEQLLGEEIDVRADLYAAGVVLYECLTGKMPHDADTPIALISKVLDETPRPPRELQADIPAALSDLVMRALSKDREQRPRTALEFHDALDRVEAATRGRVARRRVTDVTVVTACRVNSPLNNGGVAAYIATCACCVLPGIHF